MSSLETRTFDIDVLVNGAWEKQCAQVTVDFRHLAQIAGRDAAKTKHGQVTLADRAVIVRIVDRKRP